jgi:hypothetical protein
MKTIKEDLIDLFELEKLAPEKSAEMVDRLAKMVFQSVLVRVLPMLSEEDLISYEKLVDSAQGGDVIFKFLSEKVDNLGEIVREEAEDLHANLTEDLEKAGI